MTRAVVVVLLLIGAGDASAAPRGCFDMTATANSRGTNALFERRQLQGGGPTWSAILEFVLKGYTKLVRAASGYSGGMPHFGTPMIVTYKNAQTWYILDEEGDAAVFCAGDKALLAAARADYKRLNSDAKALEKIIEQIPGIE